MPGRTIDEFDDFDPLENPRGDRSFPDPKPSRRVRTQDPKRYLAFLDDPAVVAGIAQVAANRSIAPKKSIRNGASPESMTDRTAKPSDRSVVDAYSADDTYSIAQAAKLFGVSHGKARKLLDESGAIFLDLPNGVGRISKRVTQDDIDKVFVDHPYLKVGKGDLPEEKRDPDAVISLNRVATEIFGANYYRVLRLFAASGITLREGSFGHGKRGKGVTEADIEVVLADNPDLVDKRKSEVPTRAGGGRDSHITHHFSELDTNRAHGANAPSLLLRRGLQERVDSLGV